MRLESTKRHVPALSPLYIAPALMGRGYFLAKSLVLAAVSPMGNSGAFQTMIKKAPTDERRKFSTPRPTGHTLRDLYRKSPVVAGHLHELLAFSASHFPKEKIMRKTWVCAALLAAMVGSTIAAANAAAPVEEPIVACDLASLDLGSVEILPLDLDALSDLSVDAGARRARTHGPLIGSGGDQVAVRAFGAGRPRSPRRPAAPRARSPPGASAATASTG